MPRVCSREGCGQRLVRDGGAPDYHRHFCSASCKNSDKREKMQAKRARLKQGKCPLCGRGVQDALLNAGVPRAFPCATKSSGTPESARTQLGPLRSRTERPRSTMGGFLICTRLHLSPWRCLLRLLLRPQSKPLRLPAASRTCLDDTGAQRRRSAAAVASKPVRNAAPVKSWWMLYRHRHRIGFR
jgi:endogenous inhibitor of DNA gyrase (YacG/DUF329 family)